jgi:hypothetical protein
MRSNKLTIILLALGAFSAAAAFAARAGHTPTTTQLRQSVMPINELTAAAKALPDQTYVAP